MNRTTLVRTAALAMIGACAPLASAEPWFRFQFGSDYHRPAPIVVARGPVFYRVPEPVAVPVVVQRVEVLPCDLHLAAYQSRDTVIVVASGTNSSAGFSTSLDSVEWGRGTPALTLCNLSPADRCGAQVITPFSVSSSFYSRGPVRCITVRVAGQRYEVPVAQTRRLP